MNKLARLPNGQVVSVFNNGGIAVPVRVPLDFFLGHNKETLLRALSQEATGSDRLMSTSYSLLGTEGGNQLLLNVTGTVESIPGLEYVDAEELPLKTYKVDVTRIGYGCRTLEIRARSEAEARELADDVAGGHAYSEHASEYLFEARLAT